MKISDRKIETLKKEKRFNRKLVKEVSQKAQNYTPRLGEPFDKVGVYCNSCKRKVAEYKNQGNGDLRRNNFNINYFYKATKDGWQGCRGVNIQNDSYISFECCCGNDDRPTIPDKEREENAGFKYKKLKS